MCDHVHVDVYVSGSKEELWTVGESVGLTGDALSMFRHAADEIKITFKVEKETGLVTIVEVNGKKVDNEDDSDHWQHTRAMNANDNEGY
jgi:phosphoribosyl-AMP cyclohydrolase